MQHKRLLTVFTLVMITVTSVDSVRNLPATALFGSPLIFFFGLAALTFLIPTALVSAELATGWPKEGGVYVWVSEAFGKRIGFMAIWLQWIENVIWYPTILAFLAGTLAYLINPDLANNHYYIGITIITVFWLVTAINVFGIQTSSRFSVFCGFVGLLVPMLLIIGLGTAWTLMHKPAQIHVSLHSILPNWHDPSFLVALTGIILSFCGMEITTVYAQDVRNPQKDYPKALLISTIILVITLVFGSLSIAFVVPSQKLSLVSGLMQAFGDFFTAFHVRYFIPVVATMLVIGGLGGLSNWVLAPSQGLLVASQDGNLPEIFRKENKYNAPYVLLIFQGVITTLASLSFIFLPAVNGSYWLLTALASQLYMFMYILMFAAGIYLRYKSPEVERAFKVPGKKNMGMWITGVFGITTCVLTVVIGFIPPAEIHIHNKLGYGLSIGAGLFILTFLPVFVNRLMALKKQA